MRRGSRPIFCPAASAKTLICWAKTVSWYPSVRATESVSSVCGGPIGTQISLPQTPSLSSLRKVQSNDNCSDFDQKTTTDFRRNKLRFQSKTAGGKERFPAPPHLASIFRRVAACGPVCGLAGRRRGTDTTRPIWERVETLFGAPKAKQDKGVGSCPPHPGHFCPRCGQFHGDATGVVRWLFRWAVGSETEKAPQLRGKLRGHS